MVYCQDAGLTMVGGSWLIEKFWGQYGMARK